MNTENFSGLKQMGNMKLGETPALKIKPNVPRQRFVPVTEAATDSTTQQKKSTLFFFLSVK